MSEEKMVIFTPGDKRYPPEIAESDRLLAEKAR